MKPHSTVTIIREYLEKEVQNRRVWRMKRDTAGIQCSPFGVIPRKGKPGRWRLIVNLSTPEGQSRALNLNVL